jgi:hypothetical protein
MTDQDKDPVVHSSLSKPLFIWSAVLVLSMIWGLWDEMYGIRPWKGYQARFEKLYSHYLTTLRTPEAQHEAQIKASPDYKQLDAAMRAAEEQARPEATRIKAQVDDLIPKIQALNDPFQEVRSHIGSLTYETEVAKSNERKDSLRKQIEELRAETRKVSIPGENEPRVMKFSDMDKQLQGWKDQKAALLQQNVEVTAKATALRKQRDQYLTDRLADASTATLDSV